MIKEATISRINNINRKSIFWVLLSLLLLLLGLYLYFVTQTIINTATYEKVEKSIAVLDSNLSELEAESIALKRKVDLDLVEKLGYKEVANVKFIDRNLINQTLSLVKTVN